MPSVCALVVTYNRSKYLQKALEGILNQQKEVSGVLIFNNNSTDNTEKMLIDLGYIDSKGDEIVENHLYETEKRRKRFHYYHNHEWIMDDDVYPEPDCLEKILKQMALQSVQVGIPNRTDENFDDRAITNFDFDDYHKFWTEMRKTVTYGPFNDDAIKVVDMPFEGPVVEMSLLRKVGIPDSGFFIEYDDSDFAQRLQKYSEIIFVTKAQLHRQLAVKVDPSVVKKEEPYNWRNYYKIRNNIIFDKRYGKNWKVRQLSPLILIVHHLVLAIRRRHLKQNFPIIWKGFWDGVFQRMGKRVDPNY